jgi:hypothetical protein
MLCKSEKLRGLLTELGAVECLLEAACWAFGVPYDWEAYQLELDVAAGRKKRPPPKVSRSPTMMPAASRSASPMGIDRAKSMSPTSSAVPASPEPVRAPRAALNHHAVPAEQCTQLQVCARFHRPSKKQNHSALNSQTRRESGS